MRSSLALRFSRACFIAALGFLLLFVPAGCGKKMSVDARRLLSEAAEHHRKSFEAIKVLDTFYQEWVKVLSGEGSQEEMERAKSLLESAEGGVNVAISEVREMGRDFEDLMGLDVDRELMEYCEMKLDALKQQEEALKIITTVLSLKKKQLDDYVSGAQLEQVIQTEREISKFEEQAQEKLKKSKIMHEDANDYYEEKIKE
ncbi:MAG: hypothetical protein PHP64_07170 [Actinomycetota bacterium]|nr:hypothetical protein [Actinomycetota bacterium]